MASIFGFNYSDSQNKKCSNRVATPTTYYENDDARRRIKRPEKDAEAQHERQ